MIAFVILLRCRSEASSDGVMEKKDSSEASYWHKLQQIRTLLQTPDVPRSQIATELGLYNLSDR